MSDMKSWINDFDWFEYFRKIIKDRDLKQGILAEYAGISGGYLSGILTGKQEHELTRIPLILIADYLGMSLDRLMTGREYEHPVLDQIKYIIKNAEKEKILINDQDIKEIILALTEKKFSQMGVYETIKKLSRLDKNLDQEKVNALNVVIDSLLAE